MTNKKIDLGEYLITIHHDKDKQILEVKVFDELGEMLEAIIITGDDDETNDPDNFGYSLN